jgi:putative PEP-CTERM system TPR-repeat lipoprotein
MRFHTFIGAALGVAWLLNVHAAGDQAARYYEDGLARYERKDLPGAIVQLKNALQQDPRSVAALILLGKSYLQSLQPDAALESFEKALRYGADRSEVTVPMAQALLDKGKARELLDRFPPEAVEKSARGELLVIRAQAYRRLGDVTAAANALDEARALNPRSITVLLATADLLLSRGQVKLAGRYADEATAIAPKEARSWFIKGNVQQMAGDVPGALSAYSRALVLEPRHADARVARAMILLDQGRLDELAPDVEFFKKELPTETRGAYVRAVYASKRGDADGTYAALTEIARSVDPLPLDVVKSKAPELLLLAGIAHHGLDNPEKARQYLEQFLGVQPGNIGARRLLGSILMAQRDFAGAIKVLEPVLRTLPDDPQTLSLLANAYLARGRSELAAQYVERALAAGGGTAEMHATLGHSLLQSGRSDLGLQQLQKAFDKDPSQEGTGVALAVLYIRGGDTKRALTVTEKLVQSSPKSPAVWNLLGISKGAARDLPGARAAYERAIQLDPSFRPAQLNLARLEAGQGQLDQARKRLTTIERSGAADPQVLLELARIEDRAGRQQEALRWLEKLRASHPRYLPGALFLVDLHMRLGNPTKALEVGRAIEPYAAQDLELQAAIARALLATNDVPGATATLNRMSRTAAADARWQYRIALLQLEAGNAQAAVENVEKALALDGNLGPARALQVQMDLQRGQYELAASRAQAVQRANPAGAEGYRLVGDVAMARGRWGDALGSYKTALAKENTSENALRVFQAMLVAESADKANAFLEGWIRGGTADAAAHMALAEGYLRAGRLTAARQQYERLLRTGGEDAGILNNLANIAAKQGDPVALEFAERAYRRAPDNALVRDTLGWLLVQQGEIDAGLKHLREARLRAPRHPEIRYHLAYALSKAGRKAEATEELEGVLAEYPAFEGVDDARRLLRQIGGT